MIITEGKQEQKTSTHTHAKKYIDKGQLGGAWQDAAHNLAIQCNQRVASK